MELRCEEKWCSPLFAVRAETRQKREEDIVSRVQDCVLFLLVAAEPGCDKLVVICAD